MKGNLTKSSLADYTILIVDDSQINAKVLSTYLEDYGFSTCIATSGKTGLKRAEYTQPDLILLDVIMPDMDGFETCRRLKVTEATEDIPVIFMTALIETEHKITGFRVGAVDYVTKPLNEQEVIARVTAHLSIRDLTRSLQTELAERKRAEAALQAANQELTRLNAEKDKFFSIVAHDLRDPFHPLLRLSNTLFKETDTADPTRIKELAEYINLSAQRIYNLLENLLQWSHLQLGRIEYKPKRLDLKAIVEYNFDLLLENATNKGINLQNDLDQSTLVYADEYMLNTIIRNLLSNALKFTSPKGTVRVTCQTVTSSAGDLIEVSVIDTGIGIKEENMDKLFKIGLNYTTPGTADEKGTGLGLIICKEMVEKSGGHIWAESTWGEGTTFKFTASAARPTAPDLDLKVIEKRLKSGGAEDE